MRGQMIAKIRKVIQAEGLELPEGRIADIQGSYIYIYKHVGFIVLLSCLDSSNSANPENSSMLLVGDI